ncbi:MAG TPA: hypothetical protein VHE35_19780, partial [Kofleriaceae bacterium]|nr:hypothetical protein [Kofleriaceae bacterium]
EARGAPGGDDDGAGAGASMRAAAAGASIGDDGTLYSSGDTDRGLAARDQLAPSPAVAAARAATGCFVADHHPFDRASPSTAPVDPWRAVDHGRPRVLPHRTAPWVDDRDAVCDAAHDHCLLDCNWLVTQELPPYTSAPEATQRFATDDGFDGIGADEPFIAYRSVPATRDNLADGRLVLVSDGPPHSSWTIGTAEAIDWDAGTLRLHGVGHETFRLEWTRVAVLAYQRSGPGAGALTQLP